MTSGMPKSAHATFEVRNWDEKTVNEADGRLKITRASVVFAYSGDLVAEKFTLGYAVSVALFASVIAAVAVAHLRFGLNAVLSFWLAYIMTRPLGASFADLFGAPKSLGGLGFGYGTVSAVLGVAIFALVAYLTVTSKDVQPVGEAELTS